MSEGGGNRPNSSNTLEQPPDDLPNHQGVGGLFIHGSGWATTTPGPHLTTQDPLQFNTTASSDAANSGVGSIASQAQVPVPPAAAHFHDASNWCHSPMAAQIAAATTQGRQPGLPSCVRDASMPRLFGCASGGVAAHTRRAGTVLSSAGGMATGAFPRSGILANVWESANTTLGRREYFA